MKKALIIGGTGFVGPYLIRHLRDDLKQSVAVTKMEYESFEMESVKVYELNILDKNKVEEIIRRVQPNTIYHLAAQSSVAVSWKKPQLTVDVNIQGALNILEVLRDLKLEGYEPKVLFIGSSEEYGHIKPEESPVKEGNALRPGNIYAATKACQDMLANIYARAYGLNVVMTRSFNHTGPNQLPLFVVSDFCKQVAEIEAGLREPVIKTGNLASKRDFTDVRDIVRVYAKLVEKGKPGEAYNIGSGKSMLISDILDIIISKAKVEIKAEVDLAKLRPIEVLDVTADTTKVKELTGWEPEIPIEQTIEDTLEYWRNISKNA